MPLRLRPSDDPLRRRARKVKPKLAPPEILFQIGDEFGQAAADPRQLPHASPHRNVITFDTVLRVGPPTDLAFDRLVELDKAGFRRARQLVCDVHGIVQRKVLSAQIQQVRPRDAALQVVAHSGYHRPHDGWPAPGALLQTLDAHPRQSALHRANARQKPGMRGRIDVNPDRRSRPVERSHQPVEHLDAKIHPIFLLVMGDDHIGNHGGIVTDG